MRVLSSEVRLQSSHVSEVHSETTGSLRAWVGNPSRADEPPARVRLSQEALAAVPPPVASEAGAAADVQAAEDAKRAGDTQLAILQYFVERLTGQRMRFITADEMMGEGAAASTPTAAPSMPSAASSQAGAPPADFGVELDYTRSYREFEQMQFAAEGTIRTSDGKTIRFELALSQTRTYEEHSSMQLRAGNAVRKDPLVLNFDGTSAQLLDARFEFDLDADGTQDRIPTLAAGNGYLALDVSGNGRIDSGAELFGARSGDGFADLAKYDEDHNQVIDENDSVFARLRIWTPDAEGGGALETLSERGVGALLLSRVATPFELRSPTGELGALRSTGAYLTEDGRAGLMQQLDLVV